jgi:hypothetical protein
MGTKHVNLDVIKGSGVLVESKCFLDLQLLTPPDSQSTSLSVNLSGNLPIISHFSVTFKSLRENVIISLIVSYI